MLLLCLAQLILLPMLSKYHNYVSLTVLIGCGLLISLDEVLFFKALSMIVVISVNLIFIHAGIKTSTKDGKLNVLTFLLGYSLISSLGTILFIDVSGLSPNLFLYLWFANMSAVFTYLTINKN